MPNPFLLENTLTGTHFSVCGPWSPGRMYEACNEHGQLISPHVTMTYIQSYDGHEGSMLYGELAPILSAMHSRANQPDVREDEMEELFKPTCQARPKGKLLFPGEKKFPVLMLSFVGPQHGRIFYACLDGGHLVIRQSKLYSFECKADAPIETFVR